MRKVHVHLTNKVAVLLRGHDYDKLIPYWSYAVDNFHFMLRGKPYYAMCKHCKTYKADHDDSDCPNGEYEAVWDGKIRFLKNVQGKYRVPSGLFLATYKDIEKKEHIKFKIHRKILTPSFDTEYRGLVSEGSYVFQNDCVDNMEYAAHKGMGGLILNATGTGKTRIAAMFASRIKGELLFIVDQLVLLRQAREDIANALGEKIGFVGESKFKLKRVTVATIQTLHLHRDDRKFRKWFRRVEVIFIDEIHEQMGRRNFDVVKLANPIVTFGLTATLNLRKKPVRLKAFSLTGPIIFNYPIQQGMTEGVLSKGIGLTILYNNSEEEIKLFKYEDLYKERLVKNSERNALIAELVRRAYKKGKYTIVLVDRLKHLSRLSHRLEDVPHKIVAGTFRGEGISVETRMKHKKRFEKGKIRVILANKVFKKGVDIKRVDVIIDGAGKRSKNDAIQKFGRGVRKHIAKYGLLYFDISDYDIYDKHRKKQNSLAVAAKSRRRALIQAGITVKKFVWKDEGDSKKLFKFAEKSLQKEISKYD